MAVEPSDVAGTTGQVAAMLGWANFPCIRFWRWCWSYADSFTAVGRWAYDVHMTQTEVRLTRPLPHFVRATGLFALKFANYKVAPRAILRGELAPTLKFETSNSALLHFRQPGK